MNGRPLTPDDIWRIARVGAPVVSSDGDFLVVPVTRYDVEKNRGTTRLYRLDASTGEAASLTDPERDASQPAISPDGTQLAFVRKEPDDQHGQLHVMSLAGGEAGRKTDVPLGVIDPKWFPDGKRIAFLSPVFKDALTVDETKERLAAIEDDPVKAKVTENRVYRYWDQWLTDGKVPHLFVLDLETEEVRDVTPTSRRWWSWLEPAGHYDISPDGTEIAFSADISDPPHNRLRWAVFTVSLDDGEVRCLTPDHPSNVVQPRYSPDGTTIVYGLQREWDFYADRVRLATYDRETGTETVLTEDWDRSASSWQFTPSGDGLIFTAEDRARVNLYRMPLAVDTPELLFRGGNITSPRPAGKHVYLRYDDLSRPPEIARVPIDGGDKMETLRGFNDDLLEQIQMGRVDEITATGARGDEIQTFLVLPPGFDDSQRWPLVHMIHGGPHGVFGDQFHFRWNAQAFAAPGYVVALVNFHGSSSFGQEFAASIHGSWGDMPLTDVMAVTDHLVAEGFVDPERMAITGGSYGGYLTAWLTTQTDRFTCGIVHAGVTNLVGQYASDVTQGRSRSMGSEPWEDQAAIERWSPAAHSAGYSTPTLVIHGEKDYRVVLTQGLELYNMLKAKGVEARLVYYPDENHWILKPRNSLHWYAEVLGWLDRFLGPNSD